MLLMTPFVALVLAFTPGAEPSLQTQLAKAQACKLEQLRDLQARLALAEAKDEDKAYHQAYLAYCQVIQQRGKDPKGAEALLDRTMKTLEARKDAESMALLGACIGQKLGFAPMQGMILGPKAAGLFEAAAKLAPGSPRVQVFHGVHVLHMPAFFGGGPAKALPLLQAAVKAAEAETVAPESWAPRWGKVESLAWFALAQGKLGQTAEAQAAVAKAKSLDPDNGFVLWIEGQVAPQRKAQ